MVTQPTVPAPRRSNRNRNIGIGCGVLLLLCVGLGILSAALGGNRSASTAASVAPTSAPSGGQAAAPAATSAPAQAKAASGAPAATSTPVDRDALMAGLGAAWDKGDWNQAVEIASTLKRALPTDPEVSEKHRAALLNGGQAALDRGDKQAAAAFYSKARETYQDPEIDAAIAALTPTPLPTATPIPTVTPIPPKAPATIFREWTSLTELQRSSYEKQMVGAPVAAACTVSEVASSGAITLNCGTGATDSVILEDVPKETGAALVKGKTVKFRGRIKSLQVFMFNYMRVTDVVFE